MEQYNKDYDAPVPYESWHGCLSDPILISPASGGVGCRRQFSSYTFCVYFSSPEGANEDIPPHDSKRERSFIEIFDLTQLSKC